MLETLHSLRKEKGDPHEGIKINFVNPVTGEPVFKTLNYSAQLLRPGEETELKRETAGTYYVVIEGTGATEVGGKRFEWSHNDLFVVPNFLWRKPHQHRQDRRRDLLGVRRRADAEHRPVLRAGPRQGRQGDRAGALSLAPSRRSLRPEAVRSGRFVFGFAHVSSATLLRSTPICGEETSTTSPGLSHTRRIAVAHRRRSASRSR